MQRVVFLQGGGAGQDQEAAIRRLFEALAVPVSLDVFPAGLAAIKLGREPIPAEAVAAIRETGLTLKTKLFSSTVSGAGESPSRAPNYNVELRKHLGLFASVRPVHNVAGLPSRFNDVNFLLIREITEDLYTQSEHEIVPGVVQSFKIVTEAACLRFFAYAFRLAEALGRKTIHCIHKANILKLADGLFLDCFRRVAAEHPGITAKDLIVDNACMQLVSRPQQFDVVVAGNLYGDLLSDLGAGLVGGISATAAINIGEKIKVFEAVYGATYDRIGPDQANPLPLIMPAVELLKELSHTEAAQTILTAIERVLTQGAHSPIDLGGTAGTRAFTEAIVANF